MATSKNLKWVKPLKKSEKVRLRKELEKRKKEKPPKLEECDWKPSGLSFGGETRVTKDRWEYKI